MKKLNHLKIALSVGLLLIALVGCAAGGDVEPTAGAAAAAAQEGTPALDRFGADTGEETDGNTPIPTAEETDVVETADEDHEVIGTVGADDSLAGEGAVSPVVVDIGKITPAPLEEGGEPVEQPEPGVPDPGQAMANKAVLDLARLLDVDVSQISLVSYEEVQWRDSSLGCPKPGMNYLMVITPGYRVVLEVDGETYLYHTDGAQRVVLCDPENAQPKYGPPDQ